MNSHSFENFLNAFEDLRARGAAFVVVTLVQTVGSAPQDMGARMIVGREGLLFGTVGGGRIENKAIEVAQSLLQSQESNPQFFQWNLQKDIGMSCGGIVGCFFEPHLPHKKWKIAIFGAGHVAQELVRVLLRLECQLTCIDPRPDWLDKLPTDPKLFKKCIPAMADAVLDLAPETYIAVMTMGHRTDLPVLTKILQQRTPPFLGVIGSEVKAIALKRELGEAGISAEALAQLHCPIGEDIGTNDPAEIALSIAAQLLRVRDAGRSGNDQHR